ncbi:MAG: N-acetylglucosamine-6-phosphate deacetylase [Cyanobacteria bacterium P01_F01_bin.3]
MIDSTVIVNARLPGRSGLYQISIKDGVVDSIDPGSEESTDLFQQASANVQDLQGDWVSPGAVDLQINGALGLAFPDLRIEQIDQLQAICELLWQQGVSGFCPTLVTTSLENFHGSLAAIQTFRQQQLKQPTARSAQVVGAHLEGPFLNEAKRGAHPKAYLQPLSLETIKRVVGDFADAISIMTLAPEQADDDDVIGWLTEQEITVSLGHSLATAAQAKRAFDQGATMVTHAFNAMPGLHHREPGLLGAALIDPRVFCGFIADGEHICKPMLDLLLRMGKGVTHGAIPHEYSGGLGGLFLVSDALSPLGLPDGHYPWDSRTIEVINGTARLADGTLSGTTLPLVQGAINLVEWGLCSVDDALLLVTDSPRRAIGLPLLSPGSSANLLRWHQPTQGQLTHQWL